jgi:hypothetical protein
MSWSPHLPAEKPRAFLTCSARASVTVRPLLDAAEAILLDAGWRTRVPRRVHGAGIQTDERRRLREEAYEEIERSLVVLHAPAGRDLAGTSLPRELHHARQHDIPILILGCSAARDELGLQHGRPERHRELQELTGGQSLSSLTDLPSVLERLLGR